jgi:RNA polymerase sigma factor (sigma-70 family)
MTLTMSRTSRPLVCSEQELVAATRAGDDRAFEELYARYRERIFSFILSKVHDHGRAEDIAQEVFMSALRRLRGTDQAIAFKPWLYEIAKNACIDEFRRGSRAREVPLESDGEFVVDSQSASLSSVPTPLAAVESKQRLNDLRGAFGGLSANHHQLLVMREFEGLSYDEIGSRLDMTRQMVESSLFRARRKLSEEYEELASGRRCEQIQTAIEGGRLRTVTSLGLRDRRRFARHLSHCQLCRHAALMAGVDEALVRPRSIAAKIAALLPFPVWRLFGRSRGAKAASANGSHHVAGAGSAGLAKSAGSAITLGQAAATVAVVVAGAGGGLAVTGLASGGHAPPPAVHRSAHHTAAASGASGVTSATAAKARRGRTSTAAKTAGFSAPRTATAQRGRTRRQRGSTPGAPGSGTSGGGSGSSSSPGQATGGGSTPASTATKAVNGAAKTVNGATKTVNGVTSGLGKTVNGVTSGVGKTVNGVVGGAGKTVNGVVGGAGNTVNGVVGGAGNTVNGVVSGVGKTVNGVTQATGAGTGPVGQAVGNATSGVTQTAGGATNGVSNTVGGVTNGVSKTVGGITGGLTGAVGGSSSSSSPAPSGSNPLAPAASGATSTVSGATQPVKSGVQQVGSLLGH